MNFWKRSSTLFLALAMLLAALPILPFTANAENLNTSGPLYAGFSKVRIDPSGHPDGPILGLPMLGYGTSTDRLSTGGMDDTGDGKVDEKDGLFVTCIAITDQYGKSILYYGIDVINPSQSWVIPAKEAVLAALKEVGHQLEITDLYMSASHTHNGPDLKYGISFTQEELDADPIAQRTKVYREWVYEQLAQVSVEAMADREEVTLTKGEFDVSDAILAMNPNATANQQRMNYVRHYKTVVDGEVKYGGSNFGYTKYTADTTMAMEPVDRMHLIQLTPKSGEKDPIVMVNWDAHVTLNSTASTKYGKENNLKMSSDWVNNLRYGVEAAGYRVAFSQSTGGNKTPQTPVKALQNPDIQVDGEGRGYKYGARLAEIALYGLQNHMSQPLDTSRIRNVTASFKFPTNAPTEEEAALITAMLAADPSTYPEGYPSLVDYLSHADTWAKRTQYYSTYPYLKNINSRYQLSNTQRRMQYLTTLQSSYSVGVLAIGTELSFVVAGNELADRYSFTDTLENTTDNDWDDLIDDTYGRPIVMGYTNTEGGYVPHQLAYIYNEGSPDYAIGSYEAQSGIASRYSGERLVQFFGDLLDSVNSDEIRYQCACGGKAVAGEYGHTCEKVEFLPWNMDDCLPTGGNYYLTKDVVTAYQTEITSSTLRLDLNGHNITYRIPVEEGENAQAGTTHSTRVLTISDNAKLYLTDSTANPGTISRDLSALTDAQKNKITNYGLLLYISGTSEATMFGGILDSTGAVAGGGGCVAVFNSASTFTMYGGLMKGGQSSDGGVLFNRGSTCLYGGELTGGTTAGTTGYPGVHSLAEGSNPIGRLTIGGDVRIQNNLRANGKPINVYAANPEESFHLKDTFTGTVGVAISYPADKKLVGTAESAGGAGRLILDNSTKFRFARSGNQLVLTTAPTGDMDGNSKLNTDDAVYLLLHTMFGGEDYPITLISKDMDGNGKLNTDDAVYLLLHVMFGEEDYPIPA